MKTNIQLAIVSILLLTACKKNETGVTQAYEPRYSSIANNARLNPNGYSGIEIAYHDSILVKMNLMKLSEKAAESLRGNHNTFNILYKANGYFTVVDAIQGDGYSPIWREVEIVFNNNLHHQFFSDTEILAAATGPNPEITLVFTSVRHRGGIIH